MVFFTSLQNKKEKRQKENTSLRDPKISTSCPIHCCPRYLTPPAAGWQSTKGSRRSSFLTLALLRCTIVFCFFFLIQGLMSVISASNATTYILSALCPPFLFPSISSLFVLASIHRHISHSLCLYKQIQKKKNRSSVEASRVPHVVLLRTLIG